MKRLVLLSALWLSQVPVVHADSYNFGGFGFRLAPIADPWRIEFKDGTKQVSAQEFEQVVKVVGATQGWKIVNAADGRMELTNVVRDKHMMSIEMTYGASGYGIRYLQSANLAYAEQARGGGTLRVIHSNYNGWIKDLVSGINAGAGVAAQTTVGFAPPENADAVPFLKERGREAYKEFRSRSTPRAFAIAPNGAWGSSYQVTTGRRYDVVESAMEFCNRRGNGECKLYAVDEYVVWRADR